MASHKRTKEQRERDLVELSELYVRGYSQEQMAKRFGVTRAQIRYDLTEIRENWVAQQVANFDEMKAVELQKLDCLEQEAWKAWRRSLNAAEKESVEEVMNKEWEDRDAETGEILSAPIEVRKKLQKVSSYGDPRFMEQIFKCIDKRCQIRGLNAPTKIAPTTPDGTQPFKLQIEQLKSLDLSTEELVLLEKLQRRGATRITAPQPSAN